MGVAIAQEGHGEAGGADFGGRVGVGHRPPEIDGLDAGGFFEEGCDLFVLDGRDEADVGADEGELRLAIVEQDDAVVDLIEHAGGLAGAVAQEPFGRGGSDVDFDSGGAELGRETGGGQEQEEGAHLLAFDFVLDDRHQLGDFDGALVFFAVDEDGGSGADGGAGAIGHVAFDGGGGFGGVEDLSEFGDVETELFGPGEGGGAVDDARIGVHLVVEGPELALGVSGEGGAGGEFGLVVLVEGELFVDEANVVGEGLEERIELGDGFDAEGTLEVGEFDNGDLGIGGAFDGCAEEVEGDGIEKDAVALGGGFDEGGIGEGFADFGDGFTGGGGIDDEGGEVGALAAGGIFDAALGEFHGAAAGAHGVAEDGEGDLLLGGGEALHVDTGEDGGRLPVGGSLGGKSHGEQEESDEAKHALYYGRL